jgi:hypothetical protein
VIVLLTEGRVPGLEVAPISKKSSGVFGVLQNAADAGVQLAANHADHALEIAGFDAQAVGQDAAGSVEQVLARSGQPAGRGRAVNAVQATYLVDAEAIEQLVTQEVSLSRLESVHGLLERELELRSIARAHGNELGIRRLQRIFDGRFLERYLGWSTPLHRDQLANRDHANESSQAAPCGVLRELGCGLAKEKVLAHGLECIVDATRAAIDTREEWPKRLDGMRIESRECAGASFEGRAREVGILDLEILARRGSRLEKIAEDRRVELEIRPLCSCLFLCVCEGLVHFHQRTPAPNRHAC